MKIKIGTRKSPLALAQANEVKARLQAASPGLEVELAEMLTSGDKFLQPLSDIGGKGLFTKEIEEALLDGRIDMAVHSMKDMPTLLPDGLVIAAMPEREDPRDMLVGQGVHHLSDIADGAVFGTSSLRRSAQLLMLRPDLKIVPFRGNVQTRLKKLQEGVAAATMLAKAGLNRLGLEVPGVVLPMAEFLPAVAQGAIGIECRENDTRILELLAPLNHAPTFTAVSCERAFLRQLDGSCRTPIAGHAYLAGDTLHFSGLIVRPDGRESHTIQLSGGDANEIGIEAGQALKLKAGPGFLA